MQDQAIVSHVGACISSSGLYTSCFDHLKLQAIHNVSCFCIYFIVVEALKDHQASENQVCVFVFHLEKTLFVVYTLHYKLSELCLLTSR